MAIKLECVKTKHPQLHIESKIYRMMQGGGKKNLKELFLINPYLPSGLVYPYQFGQVHFQI